LIGSLNVARPTSVDCVPEPVVPHARPTKITATSAAPARTPFATFDITDTILRKNMALITHLLSCHDRAKAAGKSQERAKASLVFP
jgi:hypothetical protein